MAKILIVEDDEALNKAYEFILKQDGHTVMTAFNGQDGLHKADDFKPDIILLDLLMPVMDGLQFLQNFDATNKHPNVKVVILTNLGHEKEVEEALQLGAYKYILKAHESPRQLSVHVKHLIDKNIEKKESAV
ncbi:MAG: DNA-binding response regulator VicR [Candidatus Saccharibacteria bacterium]|nr:DNA-binding response regulator VicR [Candidatus Saccharibacteria bacterium]